MKFALDRAKAGSMVDILDSLLEKTAAGDTWTEAAYEELADRAIARYSTHLTAAFRKNGFQLQDGEVMDSQVLMRCINEKAGLEIQHLTPDGVYSAVDAVLSAAMSSVLGVPVSSVMSVEALKQSLIDGAIEAVASGRATKLVSKALIKKMRDRKAWKAGGVEVVDRKKTMNRLYQKRYRRTHVGEWRAA